MPQILITETVLVNYGDDRGGVVEPQGAIIDVPRDAAARLVAANRALYVDKKDDPSKGKLDTATAAELRAAHALAEGSAVKQG